jgi:O-antigen ligase
LPRDFFKAFFVWVMIIASYVVLIMTASRSAWLGAGIVAAIFLAYVLREKRYILIGFTLGSFLFGVGLVYVFNLTNFELGNRIQSTGSGKQEITISCASDENLPNFVENINELKTHGCRHINLEEIAAEKLKERTVLRIYRNDPNVSIRSEIYKKSWEEIRKSPIVGIGWGNISGILGKDGRGAGLNSSNIFLEIWLGAGLIGLIAFLIFLGNIFYKIFEATGEWRLFLALSLMAILIPNLFNAGIMLGFLWVYLAITQIKN